MVLLIWWLTLTALVIVVPLSLIYCVLKLVTLSASTLEVSWIILCAIVANYSYFHWWGA